jgi:hypothetical protein
MDRSHHGLFNSVFNCVTPIAGTINECYVGSNRVLFERRSVSATEEEDECIWLQVSGLE